MRRWFMMAPMLALGILLAPAAGAAPAVGTQIEVSFLLGYIEGSRCEFFRNGTWHNAQAAQAHIRDKYKGLVVRGQIESAEHFIERAASKSSFSGDAYRVRCDGQAPLNTEKWLLDELARLRAF